MMACVILRIFIRRKVSADKVDFKVQRSGDDTAQPFVTKKTP
jgi:hypothetical protein